MPQTQETVPQFSMAPQPAVPPQVQHPLPAYGNDFFLKVLCPENKKDYKTVTLRGLFKKTLTLLQR